MGFFSKLFGGGKSNEEVLLRTIAYCNVDASFSLALTSEKVYKHINNVFLDDKLSDEVIKNIADESTTILMVKNKDDVFSDLMDMFSKVCKMDNGYEELLLGYLVISGLESKFWNEDDMYSHYIYLASKLEPYMIECGWTKESIIDYINDRKSSFDKGDSVLFLSTVLGEIMGNED